MRHLILTLIAVQLSTATAAPKYNDAGELVRPDNYREWVWLTSGLGMTYGPAAAMSTSAPLFDNIFVEPEAWRGFRNTGVWPDGTMFVLEIRYSQSHGSINKGGSFQTDVTAIEMAVKDSSKAPEDKWSYYDFHTLGGVSANAAKPLAKSAGCFGCHSTNGAVENTFTQFYPTALAIAQAKGTVRPSFHAWTPSPAHFYHTISTDGWDRSRTALDRAVSEEPDAPVLQEPSLNSLGYQLLGSGHRKEAIEVFRFNLKRYPKSANAADSLADALETTGETQEALTISRKALELLAENTGMPDARRNAVQKAASERITRIERR